MKTTLFATVSQDGFIARPDGSEDFLPNTHWDEFVSLARSYGNFIVGRKTYEQVRDWDEEVNFDTLTDLTRIIVTRNASFPAPGFLVASSPQDALAKLEAKGQSRALVIGGAEMNDAFYQAGLLDEVILSVEPVTIDKGIPLFTDPAVSRALRMVSSEERPAGRIVRHYTFS